MVELWFLYAMVSVVFFGFTTIVDKMMLETRLSSFSYFAAYAPPALLFSISVFFTTPTNIFAIAYSFAFVAGLISAGGYFLYVLSIRSEEASRVAALTSLAPVFVAVLAIFFVGEIFSLKSYIGIALMILGSILISYKRNHVKRIIPISLALILIVTNFAYSIDQTLSKMSLQQISFAPFLMMFMFGRFIVTFPGLAVPSVRSHLSSEFKRLGKELTFTLAAGSVMWTLAIIFFFYAVSLGPITLVSTTALISPLVTLFFAILITKYLPRILREEMERMTIALKLAAIGLIFVGTYLII
ncbi:MAG TPA: EamA family transporter [Candidatus Acidoferrales bacterium]|nr:EamA family transporter [Candidatus Acidoferrales bacterium]